MLKIVIFSLTIYALLLSGCVNRRGVSAKYYNDCHEYYDSKGYYHKECDENMIEFEDVKKVFRSQPENTHPQADVW
jgi:predicted GNAT superfamily acetyltransferase